MNSKILLAVCASFSIITTGCGSSGSEGTGPQLNTHQDGLNSDCLNYPQSQSCQKKGQQAEELGYNEYSGAFPNQDFMGAGGFCGCDYGFTPTVVNGVVKCASQTTTIQQSAVVSFGVSFKSVKGKTKVDETYMAFDYIEASDTDTVITNPVGRGCTQHVQMGCNPMDAYSCDGVSNQYGDPVRANCVQVENRDYGQCVKQTIVGNSSGY